MNSWLKQRLTQCPTAVFIVYAGCTAFLTYLCMYAFRKPFTAATFDSVEWNYALHFKTCLLLAQVFGYAASKFIGIKVISEMTQGKRAITLIALIVIAQLGLLLLPLLPAPINIFALFINGLPLGMVWGLVFSFLEGRKVTEAVGAILCACFIFGSGVVKSVGKWLLVDLQIPELWMPFITGAVFFLPLLICVWALAQTPAPNAEDIAQRQKRIPMNATQRKQFFLRYWPGLLLLIAVYMMLTALRDFSDNFAAEIWIELGFGDTPSIFTSTSLPVSIIVLGIMFSLMSIKSNAVALMVNHGIIATGLIILFLATLLSKAEIISGVLWYIAITTGLYMAYIPFNCILFDRLVACSQSMANAGFLIYLADAFGYLTSVKILLFKNFSQPNLSWLEFTQMLCLVFGVTCFCLILFAARYFQNKTKVSNILAVKTAGA